MKQNIEFAGKVLNDKSKDLAVRFRALFMLKNFGGDAAIDEIARCLVDESDLLNHELAYCLGQMQNERALTTLNRILEDQSVAAITRHEAAEAIGAIGRSDSLETLEKYCDDPMIEVAETCQLALQRIRWNMENKDRPIKKRFNSVDPTPTSVEHPMGMEELEKVLLDPERKLFDRYRAMFTLRDMMTDESATVLAKGLKCPGSALFRHEIGFVLGQMQLACVTPQLIESLANHSEHPMVRHECAEALGSVANEECLNVLRKFCKDESRVVKESCVVALDMYEYENSQEQFHYNIEVS